MLLLIIRRRQFLVQIVFRTIHFALFCVIFSNALASIAIAYYLASVVELVMDASLRVRTRQHVIQNALSLCVTALVLSAFMIANLYKDARFYYVDFRPDLHTNGTATPYVDQASVIDLYQQCVDLGLALGLGHFISVVMGLTTHRSDQLSTLSVPVFPVFADQVPVTIALAPVINVAESDLRVVPDED